MLNIEQIMIRYAIWFVGLRCLDIQCLLRVYWRKELSDLRLQFKPIPPYLFDLEVICPVDTWKRRKVWLQLERRVAASILKILVNYW